MAWRSMRTRSTPWTRASPAIAPWCVIRRGSAPGGALPWLPPAGPLADPPRILTTRRGVLSLPLCLPGFAFAAAPSLAYALRPYLPRLCRGLAVPARAAAALDAEPTAHPGVPLLPAADRARLLLPGARRVPRGPVTAIQTATGALLTPAALLEQQLRHAELGTTLALWPRQRAGPAERAACFAASRANAAWALANNRRPDLLLFASLPGDTVTSVRAAARTCAQLRAHGRGCAGLALGGPLVRPGDAALAAVIAAVRAEWDGPLQVGGLSAPARVAACWAWGADSVATATYLAYAARGRSLHPRVPALPADARPGARLRLALFNLASLRDPHPTWPPLAALGAGPP